MPTCGSTKDGGPRTAVLFFAWALLLLPAAGAQKGREVRPEVDPYTRGETAAMEKAGYLSFGPFLVGDAHTTEQVVTELGAEPLLWVETEHFRIGSSLDAYSLSVEAKEKKKLHEELKQLAKLIPNVKPRPKELDPWLRLHLWAMRLEKLYADYCKAVGVSDDDFADGKGAGKEAPDFGRGPYLGLRNKPSFLIFARTASLARYTTTYLGGVRDGPFRYYFPGGDSMILALSAEQLSGLDTDVALHCAVTYSMVQSFNDGFRGFSHSAPAWLDVGLARVFARQVDPEVQIYTTPVGEFARGEDEADWEPKVRARVTHRYFPPSEQMFAWKQSTDLAFADHMMAWSRVDFLLRREGPAKVRDLLWQVKEPVPWDDKPKREERIAAQAAAALRAVTGLGPEEFDAAWSAWVLATYRAK